MKTLKTVFLALSLVIAASALATNPSSNDAPETVALEISALLDNPSFLVTENQTVHVEFVVNKQNEVVLLSVDCTDADVSTFISERLNRKILKTTLEKGKVFTLPVKFVSKD
ncbi:hypothetical protein G5B37_05035 [Rasiella rasia]|uniref:TonB C-terminal domain-containing protein n=1 Tax=Rasiella rasia TaxID=2744027 RepID=A0A6G6GK73_9FLAO|nr:hypothetical protein [Rasiella rasia]QIE58948.1 hypothetical protein G5B37_05035 [Rasiella rasia]